MDELAIARAVERLANNRAAPGPFEGLPIECRPRDEAEGYAIQAALANVLVKAGRGPVIGAKIGCTTPVMQDYMNIGSPCAGTMHESGLQESPATLRFADYHKVGVECEIAVRLSAPLPGPGPSVNREAVAACVDSCLAAIEIVDARYSDFRAIDTPTLIADDFFHAGCILGPAVRDWRRLDLSGVTGRMAINGDVVGTGQGADILGHPLNALSWLANARHVGLYRLEAGSIVMLGSVVQTAWISAGDAVAVEIESLGNAEVRFK